VTIRKVIYYRIHRRRVPLAEIYSSISANLRVAYADETEELGVEMAPAQGGVEVVGIAAFPDPEIRRIGRALSKTALAPRLQMRGLETISAAQHNGRGPDSSHKRHWIFVYTRI
jgi:hypothetical protein